MDPHRLKVMTLTIDFVGSVTNLKDSYSFKTRRHQVKTNSSKKATLMANTHVEHLSFN